MKDVHALQVYSGSLLINLCAGAALVNFAEDCPKHILVQYLDAIMMKLEAILNVKFNEVKSSEFSEGYFRV
jgi:hypothetical protein